MRVPLPTAQSLHQIFVHEYTNLKCNLAARIHNQNHKWNRHYTYHKYYQKITHLSLRNGHPYCSVDEFSKYCGSYATPVYAETQAHGDRLDYRVHKVLIAIENWPLSVLAVGVARELRRKVTEV